MPRNEGLRRWPELFIKKLHRTYQSAMVLYETGIALVSVLQDDQASYSVSRSKSDRTMIAKCLPARHISAQSQFLKQVGSLDSTILKAGRKLGRRTSAGCCQFNQGGLFPPDSGGLGIRRLRPITRREQIVVVDLSPIQSILRDVTRIGHPGQINPRIALY